MHIIYVDDERPALDNFRLTVSSFSEIQTLELFQNSEKALDYLAVHAVDVAFLDMEMPSEHGLTLAQRIKDLYPSIRIVFITAHSKYAFDAWSVDAVGYVMKPYLADDIRKQLAKAARFRPAPRCRVEIRTIPSFSVSVDGEMLRLSRSKARELFALLVDRGDRGITTGEGIAYLWPDRPNDSNTQTLFRMTYKRLADALEKVGISHIIESKGNHRFIQVAQVECDLYQILSGDRQAARLYSGQYMQEYSWAEDRNGQLYRMLLEDKNF